MNRTPHQANRDVRLTSVELISAGEELLTRARMIARALKKRVRRTVKQAGIEKAASETRATHCQIDAGSHDDANLARA